MKKGRHYLGSFVGWITGVVRDPCDERSNLSVK